MSNSIETPIDIDFFGGIDIGIDIDFGYPWKIDIGIDIDIFELNVNGKSKSIKIVILVEIHDKLVEKYKKKGKWDPIDWLMNIYFTLLPL